MKKQIEIIECQINIEIYRRKARSSKGKEKRSWERLFKLLQDEEADIKDIELERQYFLLHRALGQACTDSIPDIQAKIEKLQRKANAKPRTIGASPR
jgi:hypothetical protein